MDATIMWIGGVILSLLTMVITAFLGYRAIVQKAEDTDLQQLKASVDYRVAGMQRELDTQAREMLRLREELSQCVRERISWQEEKNRLLLQLIEARGRRRGDDDLSRSDDV
jgi:hypothetical protein